MKASVRFVPAVPADADAVAALHIASWRDAYRGLVPDAYLAETIADERPRFWKARMSEPDDGRFILKAMEGEDLVGFTCVLRDADPDWGPLLDNLHVRPDRRGRGIGRALLEASREWSVGAAPGRPMHLWVIEGNLGARRFYDREGGTVMARDRLELVPGIQVTALRYVWPAWEPAQSSS
jgi:GNAT superfamily N-acetyltransferase